MRWFYRLWPERRGAGERAPLLSGGGGVGGGGGGGGLPRPDDLLPRVRLRPPRLLGRRRPAGPAGVGRGEEHPHRPPELLAGHAGQGPGLAARRLLHPPAARRATSRPP